jgi:hypothetical protein
MSTVCALDHLVVIAPALDAGVRFVEQSLGCVMQAGGQHVRMGTHNALLKIGEQSYLEVIAVDPTLPAATRSRWFGLDTLSPSQKPRLATWVMRTPDMESTLHSAHFDFGPVQPMSRGALNWLITIPDDGCLLCHGLMPSLIQWKTETLPASRLPDSGVSLVHLELYHPRIPDLQDCLQRCHLEGLVTFHSCPESATPALKAVLQTSRGIVVLSSHEESS